MRILEEGSDVTFYSEGSLDSSGFGSSVLIYGSNFTLEMVPRNSSFNWVGKSIDYRYYSDSSLIVSAPDDYGTGGFSELILRPGTLSGQGFGVDSSGVTLPDGYVSGTELILNGSYTNETFDGLGLTPGIYTWELLGEGNIITMQIGPVPEPSSVLYLSIIAPLFLARRRRRPTS
ncbi:MAG: PEP-CTERM sorting domain-containing protein [Maribacter stanieri]